MKQNITFWGETLKANKAIVNTVPKSAHFNNNKSAIAHSHFVSEPIQDLLKTNRIIEVNELPYVVNPLILVNRNKYSICVMLINISIKSE